MRLIALLLLLAVLPTVELAEQAIHVVAHVIHGEPATHDAHHERHAGDEHGCTGLVHVCGCHTGQITGASMAVSLDAIGLRASIACAAAPGTLFDLASVTPPYRPPIG